MTAAAAMAGASTRPAKAATTVLLIFMQILLQAGRLWRNSLRARLRCTDRQTPGAYIGVTRTTVVGREPAASQKMLSVPGESLVFPIIYRLHRVGRWLRHDEQRHPPRPTLLLSQLEAAGACLRLLSFFPAFPGVPPRCFAFPPDALSCAPPPSAAPSFRLRHLPSCAHRTPGLPAPCVSSCRGRRAAASTRSGAPSRRRSAPSSARAW